MKQELNQKNIYFNDRFYGSPYNFMGYHVLIGYYIITSHPDQSLTLFRLKANVQNKIVVQLSLVM